ncbi:MAG: diguanylate cyclase [Alphaproteobacteria bacterium]
MKDRQSLILREKLARLCRAYVDQLPRTLEDASRLCARLTETPHHEGVLQDLYRTFHNIKGAAASFGLEDIGAAGAAGVEVIARLQRMDPLALETALAAGVVDLESCLRRLHILLEEASGSSGAADSAPPRSASAAGEIFCSSVGIVPGRRVFICDDEDLLGQQIGTQLACFGYVVTVFTDPVALRAAVLADAPDALVMDIVFPNSATAGTDVIAELRRRLSNPPPVVFMSVRSDFEARLRAIEAGGQAYFLKPLEVIQLVDTLDALTSRQEPEPFRILIVDDDPIVAAYHGTILEQVGMVTRAMDEPAEVLEVLADFKPDLVLMDVYMPTCSGHDLSRLIRQIPDYVSLPIVFLSGETDKGKQFSAMCVGAEGFLTKPIQPDDLIGAVTIRAERMRVLRSLMVRDSLTGLFNHTFVTQFTESSLAAAQREQNTICFAMIDVDHFKKVNDTHGHPAGDQVLLALARLLQQRLRNSDMVGRYGGEEFAAVLRSISIEDAAEVIDQLRRDFSSVRFRSAKGEFSCTFSAGLATFPGYETGETLRHAADQALYSAKNNGRNRVVVAEAAERVCVLGARR